MDKKKMFKAYNGDEGYIFVSYNHDDEEVVFDIISDFHRRGYRVWYDNGIATGANFVETLADKIINCAVFLCFLSPTYIDSPYCMRELTFALSKKKSVVPIKTESFKLPDTLAFQLAGIHWTNLTKFPSREEMVDHLCDINQDSLRPCYDKAQDESQTEHEQPDKPKLSGGKNSFEKQEEAENQKPVDKPKLSGGKKPSEKKPVEKQEPIEDQEPVEKPKPPVTPVPPVEPIPPEKPKWRKYLPIIGVAAVALAVILALTVFKSGGEPIPSASPTSAPVTAPVQTETAKPEEAKPTAAPAATAAPLPTVKPEDLASSGQKAVKYLSKRAEEGCPISVYDPAGSETEEADFVYDNAVAALALLADNSRNKNHSDSDIKLILDSIAALTNEGTIFAEKTGTGSLAAASIALMQYDKAKASFSYARAAQTILDRILETSGNTAGGYNSASGSRSTADNIWLHIAFKMLADKTGDSKYSDAARSAEKYVLSMRSPDGTFYLTGDAENTEFLSTDLQALAAIVMNDRTGMGRAAEQRRNDGGFPPDNLTADGFSTESTLLMALAFRSLGMENEAAQALSAIYRYQLDNGSIPGANTASFSDGQGRAYRNLPKTSASAWYILAAEGYNPF